MLQAPGMLDLLLIAEAAASTTQANIPAQARARIERAVKADVQSWKQVPRSQRREIRLVDEWGRGTVLRLIEHQ
jgi:hypothetical protein